MKHQALMRMVAVTGTLLLPGIAPAAAFFAIVTPSTADGVGWQTSTIGNATLEFVAGPATPPSGVGSLQFAIGKGVPVKKSVDGGARAVLVTGWVMPLRSLGGLTYSTYVSSKEQCGGSRKADAKAVAISLDVDSDGDGSADDVLIYQPAYNGLILCDTWQQWNATVGLWYSVNGGVYEEPGRPLAQYLFEHPQAKIVQDAASSKGIALLAGHSDAWRKFVGAADLVTVTSNESSCFCTGDGGMACLPGPQGTYDFEPDLVPPPAP